MNPTPDKGQRQAVPPETLQCEASHLGSAGLALNIASTQVLLVRKTPDASVSAGIQALEEQERTFILRITRLLQLKVLPKII